MIKYNASVRGSIAKEEIIKQTKNFVVISADKEWFKGGVRRNSIQSDYHKYCDSLEEAKEWILRKLSIKEEIAKDELSRISKIKYKVLSIVDSDVK